MKPTDREYLEVNKNSWNNKVAVHLESDFYNMKAFKEGKTSLNSIELDLFGDLNGKKVLHLQCHFGQDSISMARMGAEVTAIDLSDEAIKAAKILAEEEGADCTFICCDVYDVPNHIKEEFDIVFTSYGTIGWLPDLNQWATIISNCLKADGRFLFVEFHPFIWMFDDDFTKVTYPYSSAKAIKESETGTYADFEADMEQEFIMWNHGLSYVMTSLLTQGLKINAFQEFDYTPYACFQNTYEFEPGKYRLKNFEDKVPYVYALEALK